MPELPLGGDDRAGIAGEGGVVVGLQALGAHIVGADKAHELTRQRAVGIIALRVRLQIDQARQLVFVDEVADLLGGLSGTLRLTTL